MTKVASGTKRVLGKIGLRMVKKMLVAGFLLVMSVPRLCALVEEDVCHYFTYYLIKMISANCVHERARVSTCKPSNCKMLKLKIILKFSYRLSYWMRSNTGSRNELAKGQYLFPICLLSTY